MDTRLIFLDFTASDGVTEGCTLRALLDSLCCCEECTSGKSGYEYSKQRLNRSLRRPERGGARFPEKLLKIMLVKPYRKTDTGGQVEKTKANE